MADKLTAAKAKQLREKIVNEFNRRSGYGSLYGYMNSGDMMFYGNDNSMTNNGYTSTPRAGDPITASQGKVLIKSLLQIKDYGDLNIDGLVKGQPIPKSFNADLLTYVDQLSTESFYGNVSSCRSMCTGLCKGTCISTCNGCSSSCGGVCELSCSKTCGNSCGSCSSSCSSTCYTGCSVDCKNGCSSCSGACNGSCGGNCLGSST